jgi:hypothetical protein
MSNLQIDTMMKQEQKACNQTEGKQTEEKTINVIKARRSAVGTSEIKEDTYNEMRCGELIHSKMREKSAKIA